MKKLLLTLGSVASITIPVATVVACGKEEIKSITGKEEIKSITGKEFKEKFLDVDLSGSNGSPIGTITQKQEFKNFYAAVSALTKDAEKNDIILPKQNLSVEEYNKAVDSYITKADDKKALKDILIANENNPKLAVSTIIFIVSSITGEQMAAIGLADPSSNDLKKKLVDTVEKGRIQAKDISEGIMDKFGSTDSTLWNIVMIKGVATIEEKNGKKTLTKAIVNGNPSPLWNVAMNAMGSFEVVKTILEASGYGISQ